MISYGKQSIISSDIDSVVSILKSDWLTQGPSVERFEDDLKKYFGSDYACAVSNGTAALHLAGLALDWGDGDVVLTSPLSFLSTANAIIYTGATPDFVDIDPVSYTIDLNQLEDKIKYYIYKNKKIKAIIGVDYAGHPCDWVSLKSLSEKYDIKLVNDNCHALGASLFNKKNYAIKHADIVIQSYHPVKHITTGEGGALMINNLELADKEKKLRSHGMTKNSLELERKDGPWYYEMHEVGYNYRITDFQCGLGSAQLKRLDEFIIKRQKIAKKYSKKFSSKNNIIIPKTKRNYGHAFHLYPLQVDFNKIKKNKIQFFKLMKNAGILLQVHYFPIHLQPYYKKMFGFKVGDFPISEDFYKKEISLPIYPSLTDNDQGLVINSILKNLND